MKLITVAFYDTPSSPSYILAANDDGVYSMVAVIRAADPKQVYTIDVREPDPLDYVVGEIEEFTGGER